MYTFHMKYRAVLLFAALLLAGPTHSSYTNFESSHVHPIGLTPSGSRLLVVNTPDAMLEVFAVQPGGDLVHESSIPVGLEPVTVVARTDTEAWVVNRMSDSVTLVDLTAGTALQTLEVGDEPTDVVFAAGKAFVSVSLEDKIKVYNLSNLAAAPAVISLAGRRPRALAVSNDESNVYVVMLFSGNQTTVVHANEIFFTGVGFNTLRLAQLGLNDIACDGVPSPYPPLPSGIVRNPMLTDPLSGIPQVGLIVRWDEQDGRWEDDAGVGWNQCLPYRLADHDLFVIDTATLAVSEVDHLGTSLFEVSVNPSNGKIYVPHTEARNFVRFEHALGVQGHMVENRVAIVDPADAFSVTLVDLNTHIDRSSDPSTNLAERQASISQPGMMVWNPSGSVAYLTGIGSRKLFRLDGSCTSGPCIFGSNRAAPSAVEVGEGPTGVALLDSANRAYVLNRFGNTIAVVDTVAMTKLADVPLHDPSSATIKLGRRLLYDSILGSGHGDAACSSCHISGDRDDLAWDLGNPEGDLVPYSTALDNVRFIAPTGTGSTDCSPEVCASHIGFDPQKGPMTTQTFRGMLEPLHWRGDRATMNNFNMAFVGLMGTADIGPINGSPAGLTGAEMELFRQFSLGIEFPPNPHRGLNDSLPNQDVPVAGTPFSGNPVTGETLFNTALTDGLQFACVSCHSHPFGAAGGTRMGVAPQEPTASATAALFNGDADQSPHSDLKVPHLRNMYEKLGPVFGDHVQAPPLVRSGFGFGHDGSFPNLGTFFSINVFTMTAQQVRDVSSFVMHFPTGNKPAMGEQVTLPAGTPPTGSSGEEATLATLTTLGDLNDSGRHCELVASALMGGRMRSFHFDDGSWVTDVAGETALTMIQLREGAAGPINFLCATLGAGIRLGGDRDEDTFLNGDDCAPADPGAWERTGPTSNLVVDQTGATDLTWTAASPSGGTNPDHELIGGTLSDLRSLGLLAATTCVAGGLGTSYADSRPDPAAGDGYFYLTRGHNACGGGDAGPGREALEAVECPAP
ncbi:MAG: hypothetical protein E2P01_08225 [Acidobacteria bacterium]|nr:MAG: hypothetical protein E2P01_08225 [Acidobacteriota bacterium]